MKDPVSRRSRGFGFITFCEIEPVDIALSNEPHTIDARKVEVKRAVPRSEGTATVGGSTKIIGSSAAGSVLIGPPTRTINSSSLLNMSQQSLLEHSKHALDPRINMDEYAYNKIFVGGLHYDTRDGASQTVCVCVCSLLPCFPK